MNKNLIITLVIGLAVGIGGTLGVSAITSMQQQMPTTDHISMSMADMNEQLEGLSGDEFDKVFIEMMIAHHEGAVDMAELIPSRAKHAEIKTLGEAIIAAQTKEISDMRQWQMDWGYVDSGDSMPGMSH